MASKPKDISGNRYGRLLAVTRLELSSNKDYYWSCICDCGNTCKTTIGRLQFGITKSCGCLATETQVALHTTHGMTETKEYKCWIKMRERCLTPTDKEFPNYGAKGIKIQGNWIDDFSSFITYMGKHPEDGNKYSIDRIDNTKGYCEGNVRWATTFEQARNKTKLKINTSGKNGVIWDNKIHPNGITCTLYCNAVWNDIETGKQRKKCFSTKIYGLLPAFKMACEYRDKMIEKLNILGAGYTETHGK